MNKAKTLTGFFCLIGSLGIVMPQSGWGMETAMERAENNLPPVGAEKPVTKIDPRLTGVVANISLPENRKRLSTGSVRYSSFSTGKVKVNDAGQIQVYIYLTSTGKEMQEKLTGLGVEIQRVRPEVNLIQGLVSYQKLSALENLEGVKLVTPPAYGRPRGSITRHGDAESEADAAMRSDEARDEFDVSGDGVRVGVISDGTLGIFDSVDSEDIPDGSDSSCDPFGADESGVTCESFNAGGIDVGSEGTAMLEIVHDVAPGADLSFANQATSADMATAIDALAETSDIVIDDLGFYDEPFFEDGPVALAAQRAIDNDVIYVSACGNDALVHVQETFDDTDADGFHNFTGTANRFDSFLIAITSGSGVEIDLQWNDPFSAATNDFDLFLDIDNDTSAANGILEEKESTTANVGGQPSEQVTFTNTSGATRYGYVFVERVTSDGTPVIFEFFTLGAADVEYEDPTDSVFGHPAVTDAVAVAAIASDDDGLDTIETFSSWGPSTMLTETRDKPDIAGMDKVSVTGAGGFPTTFSGTSASAPHLAACIALMIEAANGTKTAQEIRDALYSSAVDIGDAGFDDVFGNGRVDCYEAVSAVDAGGGGGGGGGGDDDGGGGSSGCALSAGQQAPQMFFASAVLIAFLGLLLFAFRKRGKVHNNAG